MTNHPNRAKGSTHQVSFDANGVEVDAEYRQRPKSGILTVWLNGVTVAEVDWVDYRAEYFTDAGLEKAARSEIADAVRIWEEMGDELAPDAIVLARRALGL